MSAPRSRRVVIALVLASVIASGCSTQARWGNCEGRLEPINRPAPRGKDASSTGPTSPGPKERAAP